MHPTGPTRTTAEKKRVVKFIVGSNYVRTSEKAQLSVEYSLGSQVQDM